MTESEKLKSTLYSIFKRKGGDGRYLRLFENLEPSQKSLLLKQVPLTAGELPVIGSAKNQGNWLIITTKKIVWHLNGKTQTLPVQDVWHVKADLPKMVATGVRKHQLRELQMETVGHERRTIEVEEGAPLMGVWNVLLNLGGVTGAVPRQQANPCRHVTAQAKQ
jgi:hypothetical protein